MTTPLLEPGQLAPLLAGLPGWEHGTSRGGTLTRKLRFPGFAEAIGFMAQVAIAAEKMDHHPEWSNVYDRVEIVLTSHDVQGLSMRDIELARVVDRAWARFSA